MITESKILSQIMDRTRQLTEYYLDQLKSTDLHRVFESEGKSLNSAFWLMAHLAVTENFLLLRSTGGELIKIPWARQFGMGSVPLSREECPPLDEVKGVFNEIHQKAIPHIAQLDDNFLATDNTSGFVFMGEKSVRLIITHAIRHEGTHAGHLGWLCKLNGIKTI